MCAPNEQQSPISCKTGVCQANPWQHVKAALARAQTRLLLPSLLNEKLHE